MSLQAEWFLEIAELTATHWGTYFALGWKAARDFRATGSREPEPIGDRPITHRFTGSEFTSQRRAGKVCCSPTLSLC